MISTEQYIRSFQRIDDRQVDDGMFLSLTYSYRYPDEKRVREGGISGCGHYMYEMSYMIETKNSANYPYEYIIPLIFNKAIIAEYFEALAKEYCICMYHKNKWLSVFTALYMNPKLFALLRQTLTYKTMIKIANEWLNTRILHFVPYKDKVMLLQDIDNTPKCLYDLFPFTMDKTSLDNMKDLRWFKRKDALFAWLNERCF
jgi:hypothetical protein